MIHRAKSLKSLIVFKDIIILDDEVIVQVAGTLELNYTAKWLPWFFFLYIDKNDKMYKLMKLYVV